MIKLDQLRELAKRDFPEKHADLWLLLLSWARNDPEEELSRLLSGTGIEVKEMVTILESLGDIPSPGDQQLLTSCILAVKEPPVLGLHILKAMCTTPESRITKALLKAGLNAEKLVRNVDGEIPEHEDLLARIGIEAGTPINALLKYGRDLNAEAKEGLFDNLCPRPEEEKRLEDALLRYNKPNPVLTGHAGVGKTACVERLAKRIVDGDVAEPLRGSRIIEISMNRLVAGTKYRGDFEKRFEEVMQATLTNAEPVILFIDEFHMIVGSGRAENVETDGADIIKPYAARGKLKIIGATTEEEYHRYIESDPALARRFQKLLVSEPDDHLVENMVRSQANALEKHHGVLITDSIIRETVALTNRNITNRFQPDKSIDLLDTCCVNVKQEGRKEVGPSDLLNVLSAQTKRPISYLTGDDRKVLRNLGTALKKRIKGQDSAIEKVTAVLIHRRQDIGTEDRNLGTFLFCGETGVGKTALGRAISEEFFGRKDSLLHINGGELSHESAITRLIGSDPGYRDSEKPGELTEWIHSAGSGVLLIDEIEKAHPGVVKLFLRLLDNGWVTSARGERLDFRQCVIVMTTNALKPSDLRSGVAIGFGSRVTEPDPVDLLSEHFPMELLGRIDEKILFRPLGDGEMKEIILLRLGEALERFKKRNIDISYGKKEMSEYLLGHLKMNRAGARGIERMIETKVLQPISLALLDCEGDGSVQIRLADPFYTNGEVTVREKKSP